MGFSIEEIISPSKTNKYNAKEGTKEIQPQWTIASQVVNEAGENLKETVGEIKGLTSSLNTTEEGYLADSTVAKAMNDKFGGIERFVVDSDGDGGYVAKNAETGETEAVAFVNKQVYIDKKIAEVNDSLSSIFDTQILNNNTTIPVTSANQNIELYKHTATKDEVINISAFYNSYGYINRVAWIYITLNDVQVDFSKTVCTAVDETTVQVRLLKQLHSGDVVKVIRGSNQASGTHNYTLLSNLPRD